MPRRRQRIQAPNDRQSVPSIGQADKSMNVDEYMGVENDSGLWRETAEPAVEMEVGKER